MVVSNGTESTAETHQRFENAKDPAFLKLFKFIEDEKWEEAIAFTVQNPAEAGKWIVCRDKKTVLSRSLPLHESFLRKADEELINVLLQACPQSVRARDHKGMLPLHLACLHGASIRVIQQLLLMYPESIDAEDFSTDTPMEYAKKSIGSQRFATMDALSKGVAFWRWKGQQMRVIGREVEIDTRDSSDGRDTDQDLQQKNEEIDGTMEMLNEDVKQTKLTPSSMNVPDSDLVETAALRDKVDLLKSQLVDASMVNVALQEKVSDAATKITNLTEELQTKEESLLTYHVQSEELHVKIAEAAIIRLDLEKKLSSAVSEQQNMKSNNESEQRLKETVDDLHSQLDKAAEENSRLESELILAREESSGLSETLTAALIKEEELKSQMDDLTAKLTIAEGNLDDLRIKCQEEREILKREIADGKKEVEEWKEAKRIVEGKVQEADAESAEKGSSGGSEGSFVNSAKEVTYLKQMLAEATHRYNVQAEEHEEEKKFLGAKIDFLEKTLAARREELSSEQEKAVQKLESVGTSLKARTEEQARLIIECLLREKGNVISSES